MPENGPELLHRTHGCGELSEDHAQSGEEVVLTGWVHKRRDLGQLIFIELRDATGLVQLVFDPSINGAAHGAAEALRNEFVVGVHGKVVRRESPNPKHPTGTIEVMADALTLHNRAESVPFPVTEETETNEEARLKHRYVDLRRPVLQRNLRRRHALAVSARRVLEGQGFVELETPMLTRSTPEGARDYLVPSRVHGGRFFALPQSPQLFKQLLMVAGFERYYQIARCFRDEDLRADRQPEFTQIDIEMSFVTPEDVYAVVERILGEMFLAAGIDPPSEIPRMPYAEAVRRYGIDRPDTRFGMELQDAGPSAEGSGFKVFDGAVEAGGSVRGIAVPGGAAASRKDLDRWTEWAKKAGAKGLVWIKVQDDGPASSALKILGAERCSAIAAAVGAGAGDAALIVADATDVTNSVLGDLRLRIAKERDLIPSDVWNVLWVEDFPLVDWDESEQRWVAMHHPFTAPRWDQLDLLAEDPGRVRAQAYDIVLNGTEIGGGSIRIHRSDVQEKVFRALRIGPEEAQAKFGFLLRGLESGAPPHGGIALGFDRICAMLSGADSIRDVIAFPKTTSASCLMTEAPADVDERQLKELHLQLLSQQNIENK
ncbi:MAG: aspartate--tRNA ligase [bacterium]|nr:aspartate--tRNA ligase [bacterium]